LPLLFLRKSAVSKPRKIIAANRTPTPIPTSALVERPDDAHGSVVDASRASVEEDETDEEVEEGATEPDDAVPAAPVEVITPLVAVAVPELTPPVANPTSAVLGSGPRFPNSPFTLGASLI